MKAINRIKNASRINPMIELKQELIGTLKSKKSDLEKVQIIQDKVEKTEKQVPKDERPLWLEKLIDFIFIDDCEEDFNENYKKKNLILEFQEVLLA